MTALPTGNPALPDNPANVMRFMVVIDGMDLGPFTSVEGLSAEYEVKAYAEGGENEFVHQLPGRLKYGNVKLSRPVDANSNGLAVWFRRLALFGVVGQSTARIQAFNDNSEPVAGWNFTGVWPVKYTGPSFNAANGGVAIEVFEFAHSGMVG
jgi:phage tail-like protein